MEFTTLVWLLIGVLLVSGLYSSVGHGGASGYIAVMTLLGLTGAEIKPTALLLNILVSSVGLYQFYRAGFFRWKLFWPFALASVPLAFVGGSLNLPDHIFKVVLGIVLLFSAYRLLIQSPRVETEKSPSLASSLFSGGGIGLISGLTGTGGGIFLTPLLLLLSWSSVKVAAATSAAFILVNSISGLAGLLSSQKTIPDFAWYLMGSALMGGSLGSYLGSKRLEPNLIKRLLAVVLIIAGFKLFFT